MTISDEMERRQRITSDILGRTWKAEVLNWDGSVYSTTTNTYNARDQLTSVYQQASSNGAGQMTTLTYDGHGRLKTKQAPAQIADTIYAYNPDDTVLSVMDGRGAATTFSYNSRHQTTGISHTAPTGITVPSPVTFSYDAAGNRTSMSDGSGSVSYVYDQLSRLTSESRQFTELAGTFPLTYTYNLVGGLTSITDPDGKVINYSYDKTGRMTDISGTAFASVTQYATHVRYRAWGAVKSASYGDNTSLSATYNHRLLPTDFSVSNAISKHYEYDGDGRLRYSQDQLDNRFDRSYTYDYAGRLTTAFSGPLARGQADTADRPYKLSYNYDALNHLTSRTGRVWNTTHRANVGSGTYTNDKNTGWQYDADGRLTDSTQTEYTYDAAGRAVTVVSGEGGLTQTQTFDGDGARTKLSTQTQTETQTQYFVRSSALNQVITELNASGQKTRTFVYQGNQVVAWQQQFGIQEIMAWEHCDLSHASVRMAGAADGSEAAELEPLGSNAGLSAPEPLPGHEQYPLEYEPPYPGYSNTQSTQYRVDGIDVPYDFALRLLGSGAGRFDPSTPLPDARNLPGGIPIYGRFCVGVGGGELECTNYITGYSAPASVANYIPQNPEVPMTPEQIAAIHNNIAGFLTDKCAKFIDQLISSQLGKAYDSRKSLLTDFDSIADTTDGKGGFFFTKMSRGGGDAAWSNIPGYEKVRIDNSASFTDARRASGAAFGSLHEIIHIITKAVDQTLSQRVQKLGITVYQYPGKVVPYPTDENNSNLAYSGYWGQALVNACDPNYGKSVIYLGR